MKDNAGSAFLNATKYPAGEQTDAALGMPAPERAPVSASAAVIMLPRPENIQVPPMDLREAVSRRRSVRSFSRDAISLEFLSYLLWASAGVTGDADMFRAAPSAGALHPVDAYVSIQQVDGVACGLWRYVPSIHALECIAEGAGAVAALGRACMMQPAVLRAPVVFFWVATPYRTVWKYGVRGYRDMFLDAGHICENCYLAAVQLGLGTCAVGAFYDDEAATALRLTEDQVLLYAAACGVPREAKR